MMAHTAIVLVVVLVVDSVVRTARPTTKTMVLSQHEVA
jgi:hypothetical protein